MGGSAILDGSLVDDLVPTVSELRSDLLGDFGLRPLRFFAVRRVWSPPPQAIAAATIGAPGSTTIGHKLVAEFPDGTLSAASPQANVTNGPATLDGTHHVLVTWDDPDGVSKVHVYRTVGGATQGKIATVLAGVEEYDDIGAAGDTTVPSSALPRRGQGASTLLSDLEITPIPRVRLRGPGYVLRSYGRDEEGDLYLTEVDLTYTEAELTGGQALAQNEEWYWRAIDAHGQSTRVRFYTLAEPPLVDREKDLGWIVILRRSSGIKEPG